MYQRSFNNSDSNFEELILHKQKLHHSLSNFEDSCKKPRSNNATTLVLWYIVDCGYKVYGNSVGSAIPMR